jgi:MoaA/NifB/PqqE/SkfB family radical SAM enzyme
LKETIMENWHLILARGINRALNRVERMFRSEAFLSRPHTLNLEISSVCNSTCVLCPVGNGLAKSARDPGPRHMEPDRFRRLVDRMKFHLGTIHFGMWGEPALNPALAEMVAYAGKHGIRTVLFTNGLVFPKKRLLAADLFNAGLGEMVISLHGMSQESFGGYQPGKNVTDRLNIIRAVAETLPVHERKRAIRVSFAVNSINQHEVDDFKAWCGELGITPDVYPASINIRQWRDSEVRRAMIEKWKPGQTKGGNIYGYYEKIAEGDAWVGDPVRRDCMHLTQNLNMLVNGDLVSCCSSFPVEGKTFRTDHKVIGNFEEQPLRSIWNGPFYRKARRISLGKEDLKGMPDAEDCHCAQCLYHIS